MRVIVLLRSMTNRFLISIGHIGNSLRYTLPRTAIPERPSHLPLIISHAIWSDARTWLPATIVYKVAAPTDSREGVKENVPFLHLNGLPNDHNPSSTTTTTSTTVTTTTITNTINPSAKEFPDHPKNLIATY
ncbi:hypothetical protein M0804_013921 [Polistes exclamans]|nr:hypothetical protein M0804_013929 [Polistes exclamans]KAI4476029.1 hypothetical protein M0804_013921 [Polistes exclamans]